MNSTTAAKQYSCFGSGAVGAAALHAAIGPISRAFLMRFGRDEAALPPLSPPFCRGWGSAASSGRPPAALRALRRLGGSARAVPAPIFTGRPAAVASAGRFRPRLFDVDMLM